MLLLSQTLKKKKKIKLRNKQTYINTNTHNTKEVVTKLKKKKKTAIKKNNTINLILTLNYYAGQSQE